MEDFLKFLLIAGVILVGIFKEVNKNSKAKKAKAKHSFRPDDIRDKLAAAERFARNNGQVVVVAEPKPVVVLEIRR